VSDPNQNQYGQPPGYGYPQQGQVDPSQNPYGQPAAPPANLPQAPGMPSADPNAPYGYDHHGRPFSDKSTIVAGVLQMTLGNIGAGRFYTGHTGMAIAQLLTCGGLFVWSFIDGIILLTSKDKTDAQGRPLRY
jgi:TM2 domain-containing membrane protein YozV